MWICDLDEVDGCMWMRGVGRREITAKYMHSACVCVDVFVYIVLRLLTYE